MANRYWLPMWCAIFVVILGSFIHSGQTLECYWCIGESCNQVSKDTQTVNCTSVNSNPMNPGNITDDGQGGNGGNGTNPNGNGTNPNTNGTNTNGNGTHTNGTTTNGNGTHTNGTSTNGNGTHTNGTNTNGNKTFGMEFDDYSDDEDMMESREKRNAAPDFYAEPMYRCLKVITSDKKSTMRRCALASYANNVADACHTYTGLNASQASCYLCDKDKCNGAYVPRAPAAFALLSSILLYFYLG